MLKVAVVGATGLVGQKMIEVLASSSIKIDELVPLASKNSVGKEIRFMDKTYYVKEATPEAFEGVNYALFSAGASTSKELAPKAVQKGTIVIDNSSAFRMDEKVPLVVPELNPHHLKTHEGIIANPNCSTIQMVVALKPLYDYSRIKRIIVSTYQAVSGTGHKAVEEMKSQVEPILNNSINVKSEVYPYPIAFNLLPHIDVFMDNNYTKEEMKMVNETKKIMGDSEILVSPTTVRVPVFNCHSESIIIETENKITREKAMELLDKAPGVVLYDNPAELKYPTPYHVAGCPMVFVGRVREDFNFPNGLAMWVVADNLLKGAAYNAVQILETLLK
jgi:aspartate-semialdehyde dehydrogenase